MSGQNLENNLENNSLVGTCIDTDMGKCKIIRLIDSGRQGSIYEIEINNKLYALKCFNKDAINKTFENDMCDLIRNPIKEEFKSLFAWPLCYVKFTDTFGYIMDLIDSNKYKEFSVFINPNNTDATNEFLNCKIAINLCDSLIALHSKQRCYKDLSDKNFSVDPLTGDIIMFDNDNITLNNKKSVVLGTQRFMAPEILENCKSFFPGIKSDLHSLAVILYYIFLGSDPFMNKNAEEIYSKYPDKSDEFKDSLIYGTNSVFTYSDEKNETKYLLEEQLDDYIYWQLLPNQLKELFRKALVRGVKDKYMRPSPKIWRTAILKYLSSLIETEDQQIFAADLSQFNGSNDFQIPIGYGFINEGSYVHVPVCITQVSMHDDSNVIILNNDEDIYYGMLSDEVSRRALKKILKVYVKDGSVMIKNLSNYELIYVANDENNDNGNYYYKDNDTGWFNANSTFILRLENKNVKLIIKF